MEIKKVHIAVKVMCTYFCFYDIFDVKINHTHPSKTA